MRRTINNIISVAFSFFRFTFIKLFNWKGVSFYPIERFSPNVVTEFNGGSSIKIGKKVRVHSGSKIKVRKDGKLILEDNVKINYNCIIVCRESIEIGYGTELGPAVYLYDHDHDYKVGLERDEFKVAPIRIGKNCWIGANTIILRGTVLGDNCVVGAGSVIHGVYPDNSLIVQKRNTEQLVFDRV